MNRYVAILTLLTNAWIFGEARISGPYPPYTSAGEKWITERITSKGIGCNWPLYGIWMFSHGDNNPIKTMCYLLSLLIMCNESKGVYSYTTLVICCWFIWWWPDGDGDRFEWWVLSFLYTNFKQIVFLPLFQIYNQTIAAYIKPKLQFTNEQCMD